MGHAGIKKTYDRILCYFYWPCIKKDVASFIKTCHTCQLTGKPNQSLKPAPLCPIPAECQPFKHLIIDCVSPLPRLRAGSEYLCQVTRYPGAYPLRSINTKSVVKALTQFVSIFGLPKIIQSNQGSNFTSNMFAEVLWQLGIKHNLATAYYAQSQGGLERFHSTLNLYSGPTASNWIETGKRACRGWCWEPGRSLNRVSVTTRTNLLLLTKGLLAVLHDQWTDSYPPKKLSDYVLGCCCRHSFAWDLAKKWLGKT